MGVWARYGTNDPQTTSATGRVNFIRGELNASVQLGVLIETSNDQTTTCLGMTTGLNP